MKLVRFQLAPSAPQCGILDNDDMIHVTTCLFGDLTKTGEIVPLGDVTLLAPVLPPNVLAIGKNYAAHAKESGMDVPDRPLMFIKLNSSVTDPGAPIRLPAIAPDEVDYEAELAIVIAKDARDVSEEDALDYVLGYTCANDVSARDCQLRLDGQWARGKSFDTFCPLGPWIETELDTSSIRVKARVNGQTLQDGCTADMIFSIPYLVSYLSRGITLKAGTVIISGTPDGVGFARTPPVFLREGDTVEIEVEGIGVLSNPVVAD